MASSGREPSQTRRACSRSGEQKYRRPPVARSVPPDARFGTGRSLRVLLTSIVLHPYRGEIVLFVRVQHSNIVLRSALAALFSSSLPSGRGVCVFTI